MSDEQILKEVKKLVLERGKPRLLSALTGKGVGSTTAERIAAGRYDSKPRGLLRQAILDVLDELKAS